MLIIFRLSEARSPSCLITELRSEKIKRQLGKNYWDKGV